MKTENGKLRSCNRREYLFKKIDNLSPLLYNEHGDEK